MTDKTVFAFFVLLMLAIVVIPIIPAKAWEYQDGTPSDTAFEQFGPRADKLLIKLYAAPEPEWDALARGEIDITDWPLTRPYKQLFESDVINPETGLPYRDTINVLFYGYEFGLRLIDINNNPNQYLGNPPTPGYINPCYPNPCSVLEMRQAIAYLCDRSQLDTIIGAGFYSPTYTVVPPVYGECSHPEIRPGGAREDLTYPYSRDSARAKLDAGHFPVGLDGWRYWDRNTNNVKDVGEELKLKFAIRGDDRHRGDFGFFLANELEAVGVRVTRTYGSSSALRIQWMVNKDAHLYTAGWGLTVDPDHVILWNGDFYWHPGSCYNTGFCNDPLYNEYSYGVMLANTVEEARINCWLAQERFAEMALSIPLYAYAGSKAMSRYYTGGNTWNPIGDGEDPYRHQYWNGSVNALGFGIDSGFGGLNQGVSFGQSMINMHPQGYEYGNGEMTIRYGFKVPDLKSLNPIYAEWTWDWKVMGLMYDSLLVRNPYNLVEFIPWMASAYEPSTYVHPSYGTSTKVRFTMRPDITWSDGIPVTIADVYFTFVEFWDILAARGLPPPWWISNVENILSFSILDAYNFEVLLDVKAVWAIGWIGGNIVLPRHIWKPIAESGPMTDPGPDPNCISSGPYRFAEYVENSHILMYANKPGSTVTVGPSPFHTGSVPVTSPEGYFRYYPFETSTSVVTTGLEGMAKCPIGTLLDIDSTYASRFAAISTDVTSRMNVTDAATGDLLFDTGPIVEPNPPLGEQVTLDLIIQKDRDFGYSRVHYQDLPGPNSVLIYHQRLWLYVYGCIAVTVNGSVEWEDQFEKWVTIDIWRHMTLPFDIPWMVSTTWRLFDLELSWHTLKEDITGSTFFKDANDLIGPRLPVPLALKLPPSGLWAQLPTPDSKVDIKDVALAGKAFGSYPGHARWNTVADMNGDYKIDIRDIAAIAKKFGWVGTVPLPP